MVQAAEEDRPHPLLGLGRARRRAAGYRLPALRAALACRFTVHADHVDHGHPPPGGPPAGIVQGRALPEPVRQHQHAQRAQVQRPADLAAGAAHPGQPVRQGHADRDRLRPPGDAQRSDPHPDPAEAREPAAVPGRWHYPAAAQRRRRHHPGFGCHPAQPAGPEPEDDGLWPLVDRQPTRTQRQRGGPARWWPRLPAVPGLRPLTVAGRTDPRTEDRWR